MKIYLNGLFVNFLWLVSLMNFSESDELETKNMHEKDKVKRETSESVKKFVPVPADSLINSKKFDVDASSINNKKLPTNVELKSFQNISNNKHLLIKNEKSDEEGKTGKSLLYIIL